MRKEGMLVELDVCVMSKISIIFDMIMHHVDGVYMIIKYKLGQRKQNDGSNFVVKHVFFCGGENDDFKKWRKGSDKLAKNNAKKKVEKTLKIGSC